MTNDTLSTMTLAIVIGVVVLLALSLLAYVVSVAGKRKLQAGTAQKLFAAFEHARTQADPHRRIIDCEKVVDQALRSLGFSGSFADMLKSAGPRFSQLQALWDAHKLRNRIAHEMNVSPDPRIVDSAVSAFKRALTDLA